MSKAPTAAERRHLNRIGEMPCLVCDGPAVIHHVVSNGYQRITRTHRLITPLCYRHHVDSPEAIHRIGHANFYAMHGIDLYKWACVEWDKSAALEKNLSRDLHQTFLPRSDVTHG